MLTGLFIGLVAVVCVLIVAAVVDCVRTPSEQVRFVPKLVWLLFLLHAPLFGAVVWTYFGKRSESHGAIPNTTKGPVHRTEPLVSQR
jgi:hypothetical protein